MDTSLVIELTGTFLKAVGEIVADLKRREIASIDIDLLNLKRGQLAEKLKDLESAWVAAARKAKTKAQQDPNTQGFGGASFVQAAFQSIERDASNELDKATREYNRAIEEIALWERKITVQARRPWWKTLFHRV